MKNRFSLLIAVLAIGIITSTKSKELSERSLLGFGDFFSSHESDLSSSANPHDGPDLKKVSEWEPQDSSSVRSWFARLFSEPSHASATSTRELWGQPPQTISGLNPDHLRYGNEVLSGTTTFASNDITVQNCPWQEFQKSLKENYSDPDFTPTLKSLQGSGMIPYGASSDIVQKMYTYSFKPVLEVAPELKVIQTTVRPEDVSQGGLGDCYFLSSLASVARNPHRLERNLFQRVNSPRGAYCITLCITGIWTPIYLDDQFPVREDGLLPFTTSKTNSMWPMLFEKAYAKIYGAYWNIGHGGEDQDALRDITGAPTKFFSLKDDKVQGTALETIIDAENKNFVVNFGSNGSGEQLSDNGIITGHGYSLLGITKLSSGQLLLKLRNPWSKGEWQGAWSDKSDLWTDQFKQEAGWIDNDDGIFFMTYEDFKDNFIAFSIAYYHDDYLYSALQATNDSGNTDMMQIHVSQAGEYYVGASQPSKLETPDDSNHQYGYISCVLLERLSTGGLRFVDSFADKRKDPWKKMHLEAGDYLAFVYTNWGSANKKYALWTYGVMNTIIKQVSNSEVQFEQELPTVLTALAAANPEGWKNKFINPATGKPLARTKSGKFDGYGYELFENHAPSNRVFEINFRFQGRNAQMILPQRGVQNLQIKVPSGESRIVVYRLEDLPNSSSTSSGMSI